MHSTFLDYSVPQSDIIMVSNDTRMYWAKIVHPYREIQNAFRFLADRTAQNWAYYVCTRDLPDRKLTAQRARKAINVSQICVLSSIHPQQLSY